MFSKLSSVSSRSLMDRTPIRFTGDHGVELLFFIPRLCHSNQFTFHVSFRFRAKIDHLYSLITTRNDFVSADPSSMQD